MPPRTIAIIGLGPRGLSVLERIIENSRADPFDPILIHAVDSREPGSGGVWRPEQSPHLLMNTVTSQVTMYTDPSVRCAGPIVPGPSLHQWLQSLTKEEAQQCLGLELAGHARSLGPDDYPTRALYGHYLKWVAETIIRGAPPQVTVRVHSARATTVTPLTGERYQIDLDNSPEPLVADRAVLALGHLAGALGDQERAFLSFAAGHGLRYIPPANPANIDVSTAAIPPGSGVILRGLGLNFFDYLSLLTAGRGGRFVRRDGRLAYLPSGLEPRLYAGSRRGVPYHSRGRNQKGVTGRHEPRYLTPDVIGRLRLRADASGALDFDKDVWPLVTREVEYVYYTTLLRHRGRADAAEVLAEELAAAPAESEITDLLGRYSVGGKDLWSWDRIGCPWRGTEFRSHADFTGWLVDYLRRDLINSQGGNVDNPLKAALDAMRDLRNEVRQVIDHGRVGAASYRDHIDNFYTPLNAFVSIGPPMSRIEEMIALIEAGVLDVLGPGTEARAEASGVFSARSALVDGSRREATVLIEARLPAAGIGRVDDPLVNRLIQDGTARRHVSGALEVTGVPYRVVSRAGAPHAGLHAFGVPTEGVHWATAAGIRPGVDSVILGDTDAIARALLGALRPSPSRRVLAARSPLGNWSPSSATRL